MGKILRVSLRRNFTPNTLGCYGLTNAIRVQRSRKKYRILEIILIKKIIISF